MVVHTRSPRVDHARRMVLELLDSSVDLSLTPRVDEWIAEYGADASRHGADVATVPYKVLKQGLKHPLTDSGNARFLKDWETVPDRDITSLVERWLAKRQG